MIKSTYILCALLITCSSSYAQTKETMSECIERDKIWCSKPRCAIAPEEYCLVTTNNNTAIFDSCIEKSKIYCAQPKCSIDPVTYCKNKIH